MSQKRKTKAIKNFDKEKESVGSFDRSLRLKSARSNIRINQVARKEAKKIFRKFSKLENDLKYEN